MNPEIKAAWLEALRSGEYTQGKGSLRSTDDEFCCLGVLCDLAVKQGVIGEPVRTHPTFAYGDERNPGTLPGEVQDWAGLDEPNPVVSDGRTRIQLPLSVWNDSQGADFFRIADLIEENL